MPILAPAISSAILQAGPTLRGTEFAKIALAVGLSVQAWAVNPVNVVLVGAVIGTLGGGTVTGKFFLPPAPLPATAAMAAAGLLGPLGPQVATAVGVGVATALNASAGYKGTSTGAIGGDVSKVTLANPATLIALLVYNFTSVGLVGPVAAQLAVALGNGIATMVLQGGGIGVAAGAPSPSPGTGVSKSGLF
jgi:hypothetical protein